MFKFKSIIAITAVSLSLFSCNKDEISNENPQSGTETTAGWIPMSVNVTAITGDETDDNASSRTPGAVDEYDRPNSSYMLNYIGITSKDPVNQPTKDNIGKIVDFTFTTRSSYQEHAFNADGSYNPYFQIVSTESEAETGQGKESTLSGTVRIANGKDGVVFAENPTEIVLTVVDKDKLKDHILLNDLAYDKTDSPRGSSFYYSSYDIDKTKELVFHLPEIQKGAFPMYDKLAEGAPLYDEYGDRIFMSDEFIAIADESYLYFYRVVNKSNQNGGYFRVAQFKLDSGDTPVTELDLGLHRQVSIINTSFVLTDAEAVDNLPGSYVHLNENGSVNEEESEKAFLEKYKVNIATMTCPYATMDGILTSFQFGADNIETGRLLLWADGYQTVAPDGKTYNKRGIYSGERGFRWNDRLVRGLGISGKSYSAVFESSAQIQKLEYIYFYVKVDGVNIRVKAYSELGIDFDQNKTHNVTVIINAADFAEAISEIKNSPESRSSNEYVDFIVPSENVILQ